MNILQIVPELKSGGVERGTVDFARYLVENGHHSVVVSNGGSLVQGMVQSGVTHYRLPVHKKSLRSVLSQAKTLEKILRSESIDVVHARSRVPAWVAFFACRRVGVPLVTTCHGIYSTHALSRVMGWGRTVISISTAVSRHMKKYFGVPHRRMMLIHRGVNLDEFSEKVAGRRRTASSPDVKQKFIIGIVGRITPIKGHPVIIRAMARVARVFPDSELWIIGDSPKHRYGEELRHLVSKLGLEKHVKFLGTRRDIPDLLLQMDLLVAPAVGEEAFGRVLIEAGALEVPVIASRIGGIVDVIRHGKDGILTPSGDVAVLAESILGVLREPDYSRRLAASLKERVYAEFDDRFMFEKTVGVYRDALERKRILVIKFGAIGDAILIGSSIREIKKQFPKCEISVLCDRSCKDVFMKNPLVSDVIVFDRAAVRRPADFLRLTRIISRQGFDITVDFQNNRLSHWISYLSGAYKRIGYKTGKYDGLMNCSLTVTEKDDPIQQQYRLLKIMGVNATDKSPDWSIEPKDLEEADRILAEGWLGSDQQIVGINPGSSPLWKTKRWLPERYADLCDRLSESNIRVVITGSPSDRELAQTISRLAKSKPIVAAGRTSIRGLAALISRFAAYVSSDSAPMHLANAVQTPFVAIFGPTDPSRHVPPGQLPRTVLWSKPKCSPCYSKKCPVGLVCMTSISTNQVYESVLKLVSDNVSEQIAS